MNYSEIKLYWETRADEYQTDPEATTNDYYMRQIEIREIDNKIKLYYDQIKIVADIGCGNGFSTIELAKRYPDLTFYGFDYSEAMIKNAKIKAEELNIINAVFSVLDIVNEELDKTFDLIYTDRCLINLSTWDNQKIALNKIISALNNNGKYIMIENFISGQNNLNSLRKDFDLEPIKIREHNLFFNLPELKEYLKIINGNFLTYENISSLYYLVSRVIYSKICNIDSAEPDYYDIHHELGSKLPQCGDFGPIALCQIEKKENNTDG